MTMATLTNKHLIEVVAYSFRGPVHYPPDREYSQMQGEEELPTDIIPSEV